MHPWILLRGTAQQGKKMTSSKGNDKTFLKKLVKLI